jgi:hypothetical protein
MEDGYHLNIARVENIKAWNSTPAAPVYRSFHFAHVYLGRDKETACLTAVDFATRFHEGDQPGDFKLDLTCWQATGQGVTYK